MGGLQAASPEGVRILVADQDPAIRDIVQFCSLEESWLCESAKDGISALKVVRRKRFQIIILEAELPEINGLLVCSQIRKNTMLPVIFLSRNTSEEERLAAFEAGGNDYLIKPFFPRELVARIKSLLLLSGVAPGTQKSLKIGAIQVELDSRTIRIDDKAIDLTPREYDLLLCFCRNPNKAFSRDALLDLVWGSQFYGTDRTVDTHVKSLRSKIAPYQEYIVTIWGHGYRFEAGE